MARRRTGGGTDSQGKKKNGLDAAEGVVADLARSSGGFPGGKGKGGGSGSGSPQTGVSPKGKRNIPHGFRDFDEFQEFGSDLNEGLRRRYPDAQSAFQGSSVTGRSHDTNKAFDDGRTSDYDIAISGDSLVEAARRNGIEFRSGGRNTPPLSDDQIEALGLKELRDSLSGRAGRNVNFMVYNNIDEAVSAKPSIKVWF